MLAIDAGLHGDMAGMHGDDFGNPYYNTLLTDLLNYYYDRRSLGLDEHAVIISCQSDSVTPTVSIRQCQSDSVNLYPIPPSAKVP